MGGGTVDGLMFLPELGLSDTPEVLVDVVGVVASSAVTEVTTKPAGNITALGEQSKNENEATFCSYHQIQLTFFKFLLGCFMFLHYSVTLRTHNKYFNHKTNCRVISLPIWNRTMHSSLKLHTAQYFTAVAVMGPQREAAV